MVVVSMCDWNVRLDEDFKEQVTVGVPFYFQYNIDETIWKIRNYSWYSPGSFCNFNAIRNIKTEIVCLKSGIFSFGITDPTDIRTIIEHHSIMIKPTYKCFFWKVRLYPWQNSQSKRLFVQVSKYGENNEKSDQEWSIKFHRQRETPGVKIIGLSKTKYNEHSKVFENGSWIFDINITDSDYFFNVEIFSTVDKYAFGCFIESTRTRITRPKYIMPFYGIISMTMNTSINNQRNIIQDGHDPHVYAFIQDRTLYFSAGGFNLKSTPAENQQVDDMIFIKDALIYIQHGSVHAISKYGKYYGRIMESCDRIYTCRFIPKEILGSCNFFFAVKGSTMTRIDYNSTSFVARYKVQLPCSICTVRHIEVSISNDVVRSLLNLHATNEQMFVDFNLRTMTLKEKTSLVVKTTMFTEFRFFPSETLCSIVFSGHKIFLLEEGELQLKHQVVGSIMEQICVSGNSVVILLNTGYVLFYQYGLKQIYNIYLGKYIQIYAMDRVFYKVQMETKNTEPINLMIELDAATHHLMQSVIDFQIDFNRNVNYIDKLDRLHVGVTLIHHSNKNCQIKVIFGGQMSYILVNKTFQNITEQNEFTKLEQKFIVELNSSIEDVPRRATVSYVPYDYEGYLIPQLRPRTMFLTIDCPPGRHIRAHTSFGYSKSNCSHDSDFYAQMSTNSMKCITVDMAKLDIIDLTFKLYDNDSFLQDISNDGNMDIYVLSGSKDHASLSYTEIEGYRLDVDNTGHYKIIFQVKGFPSFCKLATQIEIKAGASILLTLLKWVIMGFEVILVIILLSFSFVWFQKKTTHEQEEEIAQQKRQSELRYLTTLKQYQEQMCVSANPIALAGLARRRQSAVRRVSVHAADQNINDVRSSSISSNSGSIGGARRRTSILENSLLPPLNEDENEDDNNVDNNRMSPLLEVDE